MKNNRIQVLVTDDEKEEIRRWAVCEGRTDSNYLVQLHKDYVRRAKSEGMPTPAVMGKFIPECPECGFQY